MSVTVTARPLARDVDAAPPFEDDAFVAAPLAVERSFFIVASGGSKKMQA